MTSPKLPTLAGAMSPFPYSIAPEATLREAREMMVEHDIHHLPVMRGEAVLGVISDGDLFVAGNLAPGGASETPVDAVFTREPYVVDIHTRLDTVARTMAERRIGSVIVTRQAKLAGILTHTDVCRVLAELMDEIEPPPERGRVA
jgi:CBS domain-containing protein